MVAQTQAEISKRYRETPYGRQKTRERMQAWKKTPAGKASARRRERRRREKRNAWLNELKLYLGCIDCGYRGNPLALQFDHVQGEKIRAVSQMGYSQERLEVELDKCVVRCANCHMIVTHTRRLEALDRE